MAFLSKGKYVQGALRCHQHKLANLSVTKCHTLLYRAVYHTCRCCQLLGATVYTVCHTEVDTIYQSPRAGFSHALCMCHTNVSIVLVSYRSMYDVHA